MKKCLGLLVTFTLFTASSFAQVEVKNVFKCESYFNIYSSEPTYAELTFLNDGSGQINWKESWGSLLESKGESNYSGKSSDIYDLTDLFSDEEGGHELIISRELADSRTEGVVELIFQSRTEGKFYCK